MSLLKKYTFNTRTSKEDKVKYGEILSPPTLIDEMLDMLPKPVFSNPTYKWLDPGAGTGHFSIKLYHRLMAGLEQSISNLSKRHNHIIQNMIYMAEIKESSIERLREIFGTKANIFTGDFTSSHTELDSLSFDFVIGNPPYNANGIKKVPTNSVETKKNDGQTIWIPFVKKAISLLVPNGYLLFIIPSIWMKPDRAGMYTYLTSYKLEKIKCFSNSETNQIFNGEAQTPTCCLLLSKKSTNKRVYLFDKNRDKYVRYIIRENSPIPLFGSTIINKLIPFVKKAGSLKVIKTNMPQSSATISTLSEYKYPNIKTCLLNGVKPTIITNYSDKELMFAGKPKIVMAHKMYGFPYLDVEGKYGISTRDNYVIIDRSIEELERLQQFLGTKIALYLFEATRYRMKYLERYAFEFIPDITKLEDFPEEITDETIANYFMLDDVDIKNVNTLHRKDYEFFPTIATF